MNPTALSATKGLVATTLLGNIAEINMGATVKRHETETEDQTKADVGNNKPLWVTYHGSIHGRDKRGG